MSAESKPGSWPVETLCSLLELTPRRVQQLTAEGILFKVERGRYDLVKSVRGYIAYLRDRAERSASITEDTALSRKRMADAQIAELDLEVRRGERIPAADVEEMMQRVASTVRTNILAVPAKVAPLITGKKTAAQVEGIVRTAIDDALLALTEMDGTGA